MARQNGLFFRFRDRTVEETVFAVASFATALTSLLYLAVSLVDDYAVVIQLASAVSLLFYGTLFFLTYSRRLYTPLVIPFLAYCAILVTVLWFQLGGFDSDSPLFIVGTLLLFALLAPTNRIRWIGIAFYALLFSALVYIQYRMPGLLARTLDYRGRIEGNVITTAILSISVFILATTFKDRYDRDRRRSHRLMREMNHRIKNNLALVSSLVRLKDEELGTSADLSDVGRQLNSVALIHERLQETTQVDRINLRQYLEELVTELFRTKQGEGVDLGVDVADVSVTSERAVAVGLLVNELATNALKHGFSAEGDKWFSLELKRDGGPRKFTLRVSNSGTPIPDHINMSNPKTLGLRLITMLIEDLDGTLELHRGPNPVFTIFFNA